MAVHNTGCGFAQNCAFAKGGASYAIGSSDVIISDSTISPIHAGGSGGAIYDDATYQLLISGSSFSDNTASSGSGGTIYCATSSGGGPGGAFTLK